jgi:hypothetical protein
MQKTGPKYGGSQTISMRMMRFCLRQVDTPMFLNQPYSEKINLMNKFMNSIS